MSAPRFSTRVGNVINAIERNKNLALTAGILLPLGALAVKVLSSERYRRQAITTHNDGRGSNENPLGGTWQQINTFD